MAQSHPTSTMLSIGSASGYQQQQYQSAMHPPSSNTQHFAAPSASTAASLSASTGPMPVLPTHPVDPSPAASGASALSSAGTPSQSTSSVPGSSRIGPDGQPLPRRTSRRHTKDDEATNPETLAAANLRNPVDALNLLVLAAGERKPGQGDSPGTGRERHPEDAFMNDDDRDQPDGSGRAASAADRALRESTHGGTLHAGSPERLTPSPPPYTLMDFPLVQRGIVTSIEIFYFFNLFFTKMHHIFPVVPHYRIPRTEAQLTAFTKGELDLTFGIRSFA